VHVEALQGGRKRGENRTQAGAPRAKSRRLFRLFDSLASVSYGCKGAYVS
jgi:hypothetical protein